MGKTGPRQVDSRQMVSKPADCTVGARIRSLREGAGMSRGDLASRVFVSRQTVINWEKGKTLPDVESVKLLSAVFGITVDALLDDRSEEFLQKTARQRKVLVLAFALNLLLIIVLLVGMIVTTLAYELLPRDRAYVISQIELLVRFAVLVPALWSTMKMNHVKRECGLSDMLEIAAFLEGYRPGDALPQTFVWRCLLPHWSLFMAVVWGFVVAATLLPLIIVRMVR